MQPRVAAAPPDSGDVPYIAAIRDRPRVLFLADHLGQPDGGVHGVTTYLLDVLPGLKSTGVDVGACFLRSAHPAAEYLRARGIDVNFVESGRLDLLAYRQVDELVKRDGYNIIHCTQFRASVIARAVARAHSGIDAVVHVHDMKMPPPPVRFLNRLVANHADLGLCVSQASCYVAVEGYYVPPERIRVLYTGIDTRKFEPMSATEKRRVRKSLGIPSTAPTLCLVGRLEPVKGNSEMIRMMKDIVKHRPETVLLLVGSGRARPACEALTRDLGLSTRVLFLGNRSDVARILPAADIAVVPSRSEGLSRSAIEANLSGLPVVAYACGGITEVLADEVSGQLVPPGDSRAFVDAIEEALESSQDEAAASKRVELARERFGLPAHLRALSDCYDSLGTPCFSG